MPCWRKTGEWGGVSLMILLRAKIRRNSSFFGTQGRWKLVGNGSGNGSFGDADSNWDAGKNQAPISLFVWSFGKRVRDVEDVTDRTEMTAELDGAKLLLKPLVLMYTHGGLQDRIIAVATFNVSVTLKTPGPEMPPGIDTFSLPSDAAGTPKIGTYYLLFRALLATEWASLQASFRAAIAVEIEAFLCSIVCVNRGQTAAVEASVAGGNPGPNWRGGDASNQEGNDGLLTVSRVPKFLEFWEGDGRIWCSKMTPLKPELSTWKNEHELRQVGRIEWFGRPKFGGKSRAKGVWCLVGINDGFDKVAGVLVLVGVPRATLAMRRNPPAEDKRVRRMAE
ncbi:hypothetical protein BJ508DRAFT_308073 [Ascobolus immersus RN42]|uniref:Uncharacterized protein n=1 Tax=Ascobolus immersus RN42 TaxID=1160509 RepID=A0A3N4IDE0_ASCIM|nr:hypothetical protein BJ508DRAFT_308073 [Ascobolus immersus RN42]